MNAIRTGHRGFGFVTGPCVSINYTTRRASHPQLKRELLGSSTLHRSVRDEMPERSCLRALVISLTLVVAVSFVGPVQAHAQRGDSTSVNSLRRSASIESSSPSMACASEMSRPSTTSAIRRSHTST